MDNNEYMNENCVDDTTTEVNLQDTFLRIGNICKSITDSINATFSNEAFIESLNTVKSVLDSVAQTMTNSITPVLKQFSEAMIPVRYICILQEAKWPLFLICDDQFRQDVISAYNANPTPEAIKQLAFDLCDDDFLDGLQQDWNNANALNEGRKPILNEALAMHKQGHYFASTSTLMCQVYGVASDIVAIVKKNHLELDDESKDYAAEQFGIRREDIDKEKGRLLQTVMMTESGQLLWEAMAEYLQTEILCSSDSKKRWETQPLRNKICHGDQLNFGTKEHSLKAILTVDMLIQLAYEINRIAELQKSESEKNENGGSEV